MVYEFERRTINKKEEIQMKFAEIKIPKWTCSGVTRLNRIKNKCIYSLSVPDVARKTKKNRFRHV